MTAKCAENFNESAVSFSKELHEFASDHFNPQSEECGFVLMFLNGISQCGQKTALQHLMRVCKREKSSSRTSRIALFFLKVIVECESAPFRAVLGNFLSTADLSRPDLRADVNDFLNDFLSSLVSIGPAGLKILLILQSSKFISNSILGLGVDRLFTYFLLCLDAVLHAVQGGQRADQFSEIFHALIPFLNGSPDILASVNSQLRDIWERIMRLCFWSQMLDLAVVRALCHCFVVMVTKIFSVLPERVLALMFERETNRIDSELLGEIKLIPKTCRLLIFCAFAAMSVVDLSDFDDGIAASRMVAEILQTCSSFIGAVDGVAGFSALKALHHCFCANFMKMKFARSHLVNLNRLKFFFNTVVQPSFHVCLARLEISAEFVAHCIRDCLMELFKCFKEMCLSLDNDVDGMLNSFLTDCVTVIVALNPSKRGRYIALNAMLEHVTVANLLALVPDFFSRLLDSYCYQFLRKCIMSALRSALSGTFIAVNAEHGESVLAAWVSALLAYSWSIPVEEISALEPLFGLCCGTRNDAVFFSFFVHNIENYLNNIPLERWIPVFALALNSLKNGGLFRNLEDARKMLRCETEKLPGVDDIVKMSFMHPLCFVQRCGLEFVCNSAKTTQNVTMTELNLVLEFLQANLKSGSSDFRHQILSVLKRFFGRLHDSTLQQLKVKDESKLDGCGFVVDLSLFFRWAGCCFLEGVHPGAPFSRKIFVLELWCTVVSVWPASELSLFPYLADHVYSSSHFWALIGTAVDAHGTAVAEMVFRILKAYPVEVFASLSKVTVPWSFRLLKSCRSKTVEVGAMFLSTLCSKTENMYAGLGSAYVYNIHDCHTSERKTILKRANYMIELRIDLFCKIKEYLRNVVEALREKQHAAPAKARSDEKGVGINFVPLHGFLLLMRLLLRPNAHQRLKCTEHSDWRNALSDAVDIVCQLGRHFEGLLISDTPEGNLVPDGDSETLLMDENAFSRSSVVNSWLTVREVCYLLVAIVDYCGVCTALEEMLVSSNVILRTGEHLLNLLLSVKHKGAMEKSYDALRCYCVSTMNSGRNALSSLPELFLNRVIEKIMSAEGQVLTRRSGGLPFAVCAVLSAEAHLSKGKGRMLLCQKSLYRLLDIAWSELILIEGKRDHSPVSCVHALNCLRAVFLEGALTEEAAHFVGYALLLTFRAFINPVWSIRNSCSMLYGVLIHRFVGSIATHDSQWQRCTFHDFFDRYPHFFLYLFLTFRYEASLPFPIRVVAKSEDIKSDVGQKPVFLKFTREKPLMKEWVTDTYVISLEELHAGRRLIPIASNFGGLFFPFSILEPLFFCILDGDFTSIVVESDISLSGSAQDADSMEECIGTVVDLVKTFGREHSRSNARLHALLTIFSRLSPSSSLSLPGVGHTSRVARLLPLIERCCYIPDSQVREAAAFAVNPLVWTEETISFASSLMNRLLGQQQDATIRGLGWNYTHGALSIVGRLLAEAVRRNAFLPDRSCKSRSCVATISAGSAEGFLDLIKVLSAFQCCLFFKRDKSYIVSCPTTCQLYVKIISQNFVISGLCEDSGQIGENARLLILGLSDKLMSVLTQELRVCFGYCSPSTNSVVCGDFIDFVLQCSVCLYRVKKLKSIEIDLLINTIVAGSFEMRLACSSFLASNCAWLQSYFSVDARVSLLVAILSVLLCHLKARDDSFSVDVSMLHAVIVRNGIAESLCIVMHPDVLREFVAAACCLLESLPDSSSDDFFKDSFITQDFARCLSLYFSADLDCVGEESHSFISLAAALSSLALINTERTIAFRDLLISTVTVCCELSLPEQSLTARMAVADVVIRLFSLYRRCQPGLENSLLKFFWGFLWLVLMRLADDDAENIREKISVVTRNITDSGVASNATQWIVLRRIFVRDFLHSHLFLFWCVSRFVFAECLHLLYAFIDKSSLNEAALSGTLLRRFFPINWDVSCNFDGESQLQMKEELFEKDIDNQWLDPLLDTAFAALSLKENLLRISAQSNAWITFLLEVAQEMLNRVNLSLKQIKRADQNGIVADCADADSGWITYGAPFFIRLYRLQWLCCGFNFAPRVHLTLMSFVILPNINLGSVDVMAGLRTGLAELYDLISSSSTSIDKSVLNNDIAFAVEKLVIQHESDPATGEGIVALHYIDDEASMPVPHPWLLAMLATLIGRNNTPGGSPEKANIESTSKSTKTKASGDSGFDFVLDKIRQIFN